VIPPPSATTATAPHSPAVTIAGRGRVAAGIARRALDVRSWSRLRLVVDVVVLYAASGMVLAASGSAYRSWTDAWIAATFPLAVLVLLRTRRMPDERLNGTLVDICAHVLGVVSLVAMLTVALESVLGVERPVDLPVQLWLFSSVYLGIARGMLFSIRRQAMRSTRWSTPTLIVGAGLIGTHLVNRLANDTRYGLRPVGFLDSDPLPNANPAATALPVLGSPDELATAIAGTGARHVILAFTSEPDHILVQRVRECEALGVGVSLVPRLYESINERTTLDHLGGLPLLTLHSVDPRGWQFALKHAIDRGTAALGLLAFSPVLLLVALAVRLSSPGPILFRQRRVGRDGREFNLLKFRTMRGALPAEGRFDPPDGTAPGGVEGEDRRTPVGRTLRELSLDELPQLINVLRGDMSLVGPRPERPEYVVRFSRDVARYEDRHRVKSGITGWAQVHGLRGQTSIADRVEWDNYYIQNWSLWLDLRIIALTIAEVFRFREPL
jgi:exopolysaccharide biosynthesis polyprenyl glycosylphosphotransferase